MSVKLGVPSKGRLMEKTFEWFARRGVKLGLSGSSREYAGHVEGIDGVELVLLAASEIPRELAAGRIHLGVTGTDLVREKLARWEAQVEEIRPMGFGHADLVLAGLVDSQGATEGTVKNETAEAIADITSTGETLRANHLKVLDDGLVLRSQATLLRSRAAAGDEGVMGELLERLEAGPLTE